MEGKQAAAKKLKTKRKIHHYIRLATQVAFFVFFPSAYNAAFAGVKFIFTQIGANQWIGMTPFVVMLIMLCAYTVVFGRFFCGYACAFGSLGDWIWNLHAWISKKRKKKPMHIPDKAMEYLAMGKYVVLLAIVLLTVRRMWDKTTGMSPWDAFSQLRAGQLASLKTYAIGCVLLGVILIGMYFSERFFCRVLCPMGAVFSLLPVLPIFSLQRERESCLPGCSGCTRVCPACIELPQRGSVDTPRDCFQCHKCIDVCPRQNIRCKARPVIGNEVPFTVIRVAVLVGIFIWIGV